jgi:hypothetical protein
MNDNDNVEINKSINKKINDNDDVRINESINIKMNGHDNARTATCPITLLHH